ncbi:MAG: hypothetical protein R3D00_01750 [Bacteroidia bacterium]
MRHSNTRWLRSLEGPGITAYRRWLREPQPPDCMASAPGLLEPSALEHPVPEVTRRPGQVSPPPVASGASAIGLLEPSDFGEISVKRVIIVTEGKIPDD